MTQNNTVTRPRERHNRPNNAAATQVARDALGYGDAARQNPMAKLIQRDLIEPWAQNPRRNRSAESIERLRESLQQPQGQLQNIIVRPHPLIADKYQIVIGEGRWRAAAPTYDWVGLDELSCEVREYSDTEAFLTALLENKDREPISVYDECEAVRRLSEDFHMSAADIGKRLNKRRGWIDNRIAGAKVGKDLAPLLELPETMSKVIEADKVKNPFHRARLRSMIEKGVSTDEVRAQANRYRGKEPKREPEPITPPESQNNGVTLARQNEAPATNGATSPQVTLGAALAHEKEPVAPNAATQLESALKELVAVNFTLGNLNLDGADESEIETGLSALESERQKMGALLKAAKARLKGLE